MTYRTIATDELKTILAKHKKWFADNTKGEQADLRWANLHSANLSSANLHSANLLIFQYQRHVAYFTAADGMLRIGCHFMPISKWELGYAELGEADGYSEKEISAYGAFIKQCVDMFKGASVEEK